MVRFFNIIPTFCIVFVLLFSSLVSPAAGKIVPSQYNLSITFSPEKHLLTGTAKIAIAKNRKLALSLFHLEVTGTLLRDESGLEHELSVTGEMLILPASSVNRVLYISYTKKVNNEADNIIRPDGISLTSNWYPTPEIPMLFSVTAELPHGFEAIFETDTLPLKRVKQGNNLVTGEYSIPTRALHFVSGPYHIERKLVRDGLYVYTMFFEEEKNLSEKYLNHGAQFINRYEKELGPYPYNHYVIVANRQPTGYGIPTFTLLGQMVLRLPFIATTSLGHEIVHSWFGNAVEVDYSEGNWCEGLTSYLSDQQFREDQNDGTQSRKENIIKYQSYVHQDKMSISLSEFVSASHKQPMANARRAVGYNRGALFFHELKELIGADVFTTSLQRLYSTYRGQSASWSDLKDVFSTVSGLELESFFSERITRKEIPTLDVDKITLKSGKNNNSLNIDITQKTNEPFTIALPIRIQTMSGIQTVTKVIDKKLNKISIPLPVRPISLTLDPEYSLLRSLSNKEFPPVWSRFLGAENKLIILENEKKRSLYEPFISLFSGESVEVKIASEVKNKELSETSILFLGSNQQPLYSVLGEIEDPQQGVSLEVKTNPLNEAQVAVVLFASSKKQAMSVAQRLKHYGRYSSIVFNNGRKTSSSIEKTQNGIYYPIDTLPMGAPAASTTTFDNIVEQLATNRVVYVGENHTSQADHLLQLRIIEALYAKEPNLAIGMEMFPTSSQAALDKYTLSNQQFEEKVFLKESDYFNVWRYDYRFFRDIINFARNNKIPIIGLNLDRKVVSQVFKEGSTDGLSEDILATLPPDRDLGIKGYAERLRAMHSVHIVGKHASGASSGFIQSQGIWDETMAANITSFLTAHPKHKMVVLAGSQHTRKDFGIPPRVARRLPVTQASVLNIYNDNSPANLNEIADYYFLAQPVELSETPRLGIVLTETHIDKKDALKISQISPHGKAGESGLGLGDIIVQVNGNTVTELADLRIAMFDSKAGDKLSVVVKRQVDNESKTLSFEVELTIPPQMPGHP